MKKIKMKKIRSSKIFILFGLIFAMFTACIFGFKSYAYTPNNEGDLINNNILPCNLFEVEQYYIGSTQYGLKGDFSVSNSTNNMFIMDYTADSRDFVNGVVSFYVFTEQYNINYDSNNYLFMTYYDDKLNFTYGFGDDKNNIHYPTTSDEYFSYNDMEIYYSNYLNHTGGIRYIKINFYGLTVGETYHYWFYLNVVPISSLWNDYAFNPMYSDESFDSHQDLVDLNNQLNSYISQNNSLQSQVNNLQNQVNQLTNSNHVLLQQLANANNDYNLNNLVWSIGGTPFETFKTIWNFEFFGVNISNLIFGLLTGLIVIWIIKKFFL